jgi:hypothetical protein
LPVPIEIAVQRAETIDEQIDHIAVLLEAGFRSR